jgi:hypothetical protein
LTGLGEEILSKLASLHQEEITRVRDGFLNIAKVPDVEHKKQKNLT